MGFVRIKTIKGRKYAYLVENKWTPKGPRQKSKAYLGRVYEVIKEREIAFDELHSQRERTKSELIQDLLGLELHNHGFAHEGGVWSNKEVTVDVKNSRVFNVKDKNVAISMNEGVLCGQTLAKVSSVNVTEREQDEGYALAKSLVEAGFNVPKEKFIELYEKFKA